MFRTTLIIITMLITSMVYGSPVKIKVPMNDGTSFHGSGVYIHDGVAEGENVGFVYTNAHVVRDHNNQFIVSTPPCLFAPLGERFQGKVIYRNEAIDIAVIVILRPKSVHPTPIADVDIPLRTEVYTWANSPQRGLRTVIHKGITVGYLNDGLVTELSFKVINGDSGSPVLYNNKVVGLIFANSRDAPTGLMTNWKALNIAHNTVINTKQYGCDNGTCGPGYGQQPYNNGNNQQELEDFNPSVVDYTKDFEELKSNVATITPKIDELSNQLNTVKAEVDNTKAVVATNATTANRNSEAALTKINTVQTEIGKVRTDVNNVKTEAIDTVNQMAQATERSLLTKVSDKLRAVDRTKEALETKYTNIDNKYTQVKSKITAVHNTVTKIEQSRGIVNTVMILKASGVPLTGIAAIMCAWGAVRYIRNRRASEPVNQAPNYQPNPNTVGGYYSVPVPHGNRYVGQGGVVYPPDYQPQYQGYKEPEKKEEPNVVYVQAPILPQVERPNNDYVPYETNDYRLAVQEAQKQAAKRFPGSTGVLEYVDQMVDQIMNARKGK